MSEWQMDPLYARYPFLDAAREAVHAADIDLAELVFESTAPEIDRAIERIDGAITAGRVPDPITDHRVELLSYPIARVLVSLVDEPALTARYAVAEARRAFNLLTTEPSDAETLRTASAPRLTIDELIEEFGLDIRPHADEQGYLVDLVTYLTLTTDLYGEEWRLVNRGVADGTVHIRDAERDVLVREAIRSAVADGLPLTVPDEIAGALEAHVGAIERSLADVHIPDGIGRVVPAQFPPCMDELLDRLRAGDDLTALEQFTIVSFLTCIGLDQDGVIEMIEPPTRADEAQLRYLVEHIHGGSSSTAYPPPTCATLLDADVCVDAPERCEADGHPLVAYARAIADTGK